MSKFTPGPWEWDDLEQWGKSAMYYSRNLLGKDDIPVLSGEDYTIEMQIEDARLISAAPNMYEVCIGLEKWWRLPNSERTIEAIEPVIHDALEALAKADSK